MPAQKTNKNYLTTSKAAKYIGVSPTTLRRLESEGKILARRLDNGYRVFDISTLDDLKEKLEESKTISHLEVIKSTTTQTPIEYKTAKIETTEIVKPVKDKEVSDRPDRLQKPQTIVRTANRYNTLLRVATAGIGVLFIAMIIGTSLYTVSKVKGNIESILSYNTVENEELNEEVDVLGTRDRLTDFWFYINVPTNIDNDLVVGGNATFEGNVVTPGVNLTGTGTLSGLAAIDVISQTTLENTLNIGGDLEGALSEATILDGVIDGDKLATDINYDGSFEFSDTINITGTFEADGDGGSDGQVLTSTGSGVEWADIDAEDANTLDGIDSLQFLRSDISDEFTSGTLSFSDSTFLDLSAITHDDTTLQGLRLPQADYLEKPASGEGFLAYEADENRILIYNGTNWTNISGSSSSLQEGYQIGNTIAMDAAEGDLRIFNDSSNELLFLDESTGRIGIGNTGPAYKLDVTGTLRATGYTFLSGLNSSTSEDTIIVVSPTGELLERDFSDFVSDDLIASGSGDINFIPKWNPTGILTDSNLYDNGTNVGIGTTNPAYKLDINGDANIASGSDLYSYGTATLGNRSYTEDNYVVDSTTFTAAIDILDQTLADVIGGTAGIWNDQTTYIEPSTLSSGSFVIEDGGNVGIGTTNPTYTLEVIGDFLAGNLAISNSTLSALTNAGLFLYEDGGNGVFIEDGGNVGIGTTNPDSKLDVVGSFSATDTVTLDIISTDGVVTASSGVLSSKAEGSGGLIDVDFLDSLDSSSFLRSDASDSYTSGILSFSDGTFLDLSAITHDDTAVQGLRLPQADTLSNPTSGEGYIAYDTDADKVFIYNGTTWTDVSGASTALQEAYEAGEEVELSAAQGDIRFYTDGGDELLFLDEDTGRVGIGNTGPAYKLDVTGSFRATGNTFLSGLNTGADNTVLVLNSSNEVVTDEIDSRVWDSTLLDDTDIGVNVQAYSANTTTLGNTISKDELENSGVLAFDWVDSEIADDLTLETISGTPVVSNGISIGTDSTNYLIDDATNGSGSATLYIGNESILASGDIGVTVQGYNANTSLLGQTIESSEITDGTVTNIDLANSAVTVTAGTGLTGGGAVSLGGSIELQSALGTSIETGEITDDTILEADLDLTNTASGAGDVLTYDGVSGFTWTTSGAVGTNYWDRTGTTLSPLTAGDNIVTSGNIGAGTTNPSYTLEIAGTFGVTGLSTGTDNTVLVLSGGEVVTDEIDSRVWGSTLLDTSDIGVSVQGYNVNTTILGNTISKNELENSGTLAFDWIDSEIADDLSLETISGTPVVTNGLRIGTDSTDNLIDNNTNGSGSATLYIGNESILASGDIGVTVQGYNANTSLLGQTIESSEIADGTVANIDLANSSVTITAGTGLTGGGAVSLGGSVELQSSLGTSIEGSEITDSTIEEADLELTNSPTDNYILSYDLASGGFTWIDPTTAGAIDGSGTANYIPLWSASDTLTSSSIYETGGQIGIGTTAPSTDFEVANTARFTGSVQEAAQSTDRIDIGVEAGTPRMVFEDNGSTIWEIDNSSGIFRWFTPGIERLTLDATGNLDLKTGGLRVGGTSVLTSGRALQNLTGITSGGTITFSGLSTGTDNSVIVLNGSNQLVTDEIDSRVWGSTLLDDSDIGVNVDNYVSWLAADNDGDTYPITSGDTFQIVEGTGIDVDFTGDDVMTITNVGDTDTTNELQNLAEVYAQDGSTGNEVQLTATNGDIRFYNDDGFEMLFFDESLGQIGIGMTAPTDKLYVEGRVTATSGFHVGIDTDNNLLDDSSHGAGSTTLYIGNESILTSGDIGSTVQGYNANTSLLGQTIEGSEITDNTIEEADLELTNSPTDNYILSYDLASGGFTWIDNTGGSGASKWTDDGAFTYLTATSDDVIFGDSDTTDAPFWFDVSTSDITLGGASTGNGFETTIDVTDPTADRTIVLPDGDGEISLLGQSIATGEITDDSILEVDLDVTNSPTDNYILSYDLASGGFTWIDASGAGVGSLSGTGTANYLTKWDGTNSITDSVIYETGGQIGIGTTAPQSELHIAGDIRVPNGNRVYFDNTNDYNYFDFSSGRLTMGYTADAFEFDMNTTSIKTIEVVSNSDFRLLGANNKNLLLTTQGTGNTIVSGGMVGIGTTDPNSLVHLGSSHLSRDLQIDADASTIYGNSPAIFTTGVGGSGIFSEGGHLVFQARPNSTRDIIFLAGNTSTEAMRLTGEGNLGIGITEPAYKLDVNGTAGFASTIYAQNIGADTDNSVVILNSSGLLKTDEIDSRVWGSTLLDDTDIGVNIQAYNVNTSLLGQTIESSEITDDEILEADLDITNSPTDDYILSYDLASGGFTWIDGATAGAFDGSGTANYLPLWSDSNTLTSSSIYETGGQIGIGTTNPTSTLTILEDGGPAISLIHPGNLSAQDNLGSIDFYRDTTILGAQIRAIAEVADDNRHTGLIFSTSTFGGTLLDAMKISNQQYVGIGNTNPSTRLSIGSLSNSLASDGVGSVSTRGLNLRVTNTFDYAAAIENAYGNGGNGLLLRAGRTADGDEFVLRAQNINDLELMTVMSSGRVGIGTTEPAYKLDVNGTAGFASTIYAENIGADTDNSVVILNSSGLLKTDEIDSRVWGSTLLDDTDIGVNIQAYNANTSLLGQTIESSEITDGTVANADLTNSSVTVTAGTGLTGGGAVSLGGSVELQSALGTSIETGEITDDTILEADLDITNSPTDDYFLTYDLASGGFTWVDGATVGAFDGSGTANYLPLWSDSNTLTSSSIYETGGQIGIGTTAPTGLFDIAADNDDTINISTSLAAGNRTTDFVTISQPDSSYIPTGDLLTVSNSETLFTGSLLKLSSASTSSYATNFIDIPSTLYNSDVGINMDGFINGVGIKLSDGGKNNSGDYIQINGVINGGNGINFPATISNGDGIDFGQIASGGIGINFDSGGMQGTGIFINGAYPGAAGFKAIEVGGSRAGSIQPYIEDIVAINPTRNSGSTATDTGRFLAVERDDSSYSNTLTLTDLVAFSSDCGTSGSGTCVDDSSVLTLAQNYASSTGTVLEVTGAGSGYLLNVIDGSNEVFTIEDGGRVGIGITDPSYLLDVNGTAGFASTIYAENIGADTDNSVVILNSSGLLKTDEIDSRVWGSTLLDDTDIGVNIQAYNANTSLLGQTIETGEITDDEILEADLDITNSPTDNYILTFDNGTGGFTWVDPTTVGSGGTFDGTGVANYITKFTDSDTLEASVIYETGGQLGIGTTAPSSELDVIGTIEVSSGSSTEPTYTFGADPNTGLYNPSADQLGFVTNGGLRMTLTGTYLYGEQAAGRTAVYIGGGGSPVVPNYTFYGDTGTGMYRPEAFNIGFSTNEVERVRIDNNGNLGIGTTDPSYLLDVNGTAGFASTIYAENIGTDTDNSVVILNSSGLLKTDEIDSRVWGSTLLDDTDIGVNVQGYDADTSLIGQTIETGEITDDEILEADLDVTNTPTDDYILSYDLASGGFTWIENTGGGGNFDGTGVANYITKFTDADTLEASVIYETGGNIGIGTTNPQNKLDIVGADYLLTSSNETDATVKIGRIGTKHYTNAEQPFVWVNPQTSATNNVLDMGGGTSIGNAATLVRFFTAANNTTTTGTERFRISSAGNVGINETNPLYKLDVDGDAHLTDNLYFENNKGMYFDANNFIGHGPSSTEIHVTSGGSANFNIDSNNNTTTAEFVFAKDRTSTSGGTELFSIQEDGDVVIGGTNPVTLSKSTAGSLNITPTSGITQLLGTEGTMLKLHDNNANNDQDMNISIDWYRNSGATEVARLGPITTGDTDFYIRNAAAGGIKFQTSGANAMYLSSAGDLGIGTTGPAYKLDVNGTFGTNDTVTLTGLGSSTTEDTIIVMNGSNELEYREFSDFLGDDSIVDSTGTANYIAKFTDSNTIEDSILYETGGQIGIGTTNPTSTLDINGNIRMDSTATYIEMSNGSGTWDTNLYRQAANSLRTDDGLIVGIRAPAGNMTPGDIRTSGTISTGNVSPDNSSLVALRTVHQVSAGAGEVAYGTAQTIAAIPTDSSAKVIGASYEPRNTGGSQNFSSVTGVRAYPRLYTGSTATVTDMTGFESVPANVSGSTITNLYGFKYDSDFLGGTVTNEYGLYIGDAVAGSSVANSIYTNLGSVSLGDDLLLRNDNDKIQLGAGGDLNLYHDGTNSYIMNNTGDLYISDTSTDNVILSNNGGFVGIGTTSPNSKLHVLGPSEIIRVDSVGATASPFISFAQANTRRGFIQYEDTNDSLTLVSEYGQLNFKTGTGGTETTKMTILSGGNVGIGTTNPAAKLDLDSASNSQAVRIRGLAETAEITDMYVGADGQFVLDNTAGTDSAAYLDFRSEDDAYGMVLRESDGTGISTFANLYVTDSTTDYLNIVTNAASSTLGLVVDENQNVGVGTNSLAYKLDVLSSDTTGALRLTADSVTTGTGALFSFDGLTSGTGVLIESDSSTTLSGDLLRLNVGSGTTVTGNIFSIADNGSDLFTVDQSQITSALPHSFTAAGDVSMAYDLILTNQTSSKIESYGPLTIEAGESFENNDLTLKTYGAGNLIINSSNIWTDGNEVGIGSTAPTSYKFYVKDNDGGTSGAFVQFIENENTGSNADGLVIKLGAAAANTNNMYAYFIDGGGGVGSITGNGTGINYNNTSDVRLKNLLGEYENALETINSINSYYYEMKDTPGITAVGFAAQELNEVYPYAVTGDPENDPYENPMMVDYSKLTPLLLAGIKEQQAEIDLIQEMLGLETAGESSMSDSLAGLTGTINEMTAIFDEFKAFVEALGLSKQTDIEGNDVLAVASDLNVVGNTTLSDVTITGNLTAGLIELDTTENTLNVLGASCYNPDTGTHNETVCADQELKIQSTLAGNVNFFDGGILLEPDGTINVEKLAINVSDEAAASAGKAVILEGETVIEVHTTALTDNSLILITPDEPVAVGKRIVDEDTFEITLQNVQDKDITVDWLIVDLNE